MNLYYWYVTVAKVSHTRINLEAGNAEIAEKMRELLRSNNLI